MDPSTGTGNPALIALGRRGLTAGLGCQFQLLAQLGQQLGGGLLGHFGCFSCTSVASLWIRLMASLRCAPTFAM